MNNKEYLNEESYQKSKKKIKKISMIILIVGIIIGISLIIGGVIKQNSVKKYNEKLYNEAYELSKQKVAKAEARLKEIDTQKSNLNNKINAKENECDSMNMRDPNWYADVNKCRREASSLQSQLNELESEEFQIENANYKVTYYPLLPIKYLIFYYIGSGVILVSCLISGIFYYIANKREIKAFTIQQSMPLNQEAIDKMSPTVGKAAGTIAKEIVSGVKEEK